MCYCLLALYFTVANDTAGSLTITKKQPGSSSVEFQPSNDQTVPSYQFGNLKVIIISYSCNIATSILLAN